MAVAAVLLIATRGGSDDEAAEPAPAQPEVAAKQVPATTPEPEPPAPRPPEPKLLVSVRSNVPAEIFRDGKKLGTTPVDVEVPVDGRAIDLVARKPGYLEQVVTVSSQHGEAVDVELQPKKKRKKKKKKTGNERVADPESFELEAVE